MKLYTEDQIKAAYNTGYTDAQVNHINDSEQYTEALTPIEIPTDEEIQNGWDEKLGEDYINGCINGAKWMRDKIKGGNK